MGICILIHINVGSDLGVCDEFHSDFPSVREQFENIRVIVCDICGDQQPAADDSETSRVAK
jgi:hypothetical protein